MDGKHGFVYAPLAMVVPEGVVHRAFAGIGDVGGCRVRRNTFSIWLR